MVFDLSALNRVYNFVRVCPNYKQDEICLQSKYTKAMTIDGFHASRETQAIFCLPSTSMAAMT